MNRIKLFHYSITHMAVNGSEQITQMSQNQELQNKDYEERATQFSQFKPSII